MKNDDLNYVSLLAKDSIVNEKCISVPSNLKISGTVHKDIECKGKLVIAGPGVVEGNLKTKTMVLEGTFRGNAWVQEVLSISGSATFSGYISADKIRIEEGAVCDFKADIDKNAKKRFKKSVIYTDQEQISKTAEKKMVHRPKAAKKKAESVETDLPVKKNRSPDQNRKKDETDHFW